MKSLATILLLVIVIVSGSWSLSADRKHKSHALRFIVPPGWPQPEYDFKNNPPTQEGFALGKKLFYDGRLSKDGNFPCASCHQQYAAFATYDHSLSHGFNNTFTKRNAPPLFNLAWQREFMWDGGINHLDLQPLAPMTDMSEMGENLDSILLKLRADTGYRGMFRAAFGNDSITTQQLTRALSQFIVMMVSANSKYDRVKRGTDSFTLPEKLGYEIFKRKCENCHREPLFTDLTYRNTGLTADDYLKDNGRMKITRDAHDSLKFKVPSLRNVQLTFPYGHDGRFYSLLQVMDHYRKDVVSGPTTDSLLRHGIPLSNFEIGQLTAFLYTLTDSTLINDPRFAPPDYRNRTQQKPLEHEHIYEQ